MEANYVAKKSVWAVISIWHILLCWLIIPLIIMVVKIFIAKSYVIEFYDNKVIVKSGILTKKERQSILTNVASVSIEQTLMGRICNYGDIKVDIVGRWDVNTEGIKNPKGLKEYLNKYVSSCGVQQVIMN